MTRLHFVIIGIFGVLGLVLGLGMAHSTTTTATIGAEQPASKAPTCAASTLDEAPGGGCGQPRRSRLR